MVEILLRDFRDGADGELYWATEREKLLGRDAVYMGCFHL